MILSNYSEILPVIILLSLLYATQANPAPGSGRLKEITDNLKKLQENPNWPRKRTLKSYNHRLTSNKNALDQPSTSKLDSPTPHQGRSMKSSKNCSTKNQDTRIRTLPRPEDMKNLKSNRTARKNHTLPPLRKAETETGNDDCAEAVMDSTSNTTKIEIPTNISHQNNTEFPVEVPIHRHNASMLTVNETHSSSNSNESGSNATIPTTTVPIAIAAGRSIQIEAVSKAGNCTNGTGLVGLTIAIDHQNSSMLAANETSNSSNQSSSDANSSEPIAVGRSIEVKVDKIDQKQTTPSTIFAETNAGRSIAMYFYSNGRETAGAGNATASPSESTTISVSLAPTTIYDIPAVTPAGKSISIPGNPSPSETSNTVETTIRSENGQFILTTTTESLAAASPVGRSISMYVYSNGREAEDGNETVYPSESTTTSASMDTPTVTPFGRSISIPVYASESPDAVETTIPNNHDQDQSIFTSTTESLTAVSPVGRSISMYVYSIGREAEDGSEKAYPSESTTDTPIVTPTGRSISISGTPSESLDAVETTIPGDNNQSILTTTTESLAAASPVGRSMSIAENIAKTHDPIEIGTTTSSQHVGSDPVTTTCSSVTAGAGRSVSGNMHSQTESTEHQGDAEAGTRSDGIFDTQSFTSASTTTIQTSSSKPDSAEPTES